MPGESATTSVGTATCFLSAVILSIVALATPSWIVQNFQGQARFGLFVNCIDQRYAGEVKTVCSTPDQLPPQWRATAALLILAIMFMLVATVFGALSYMRAPHLSHSKWIAFGGSIFHSLASLIFPLGFEGEPIGGRAFKLPDQTAVGYSYAVFVVALVLIFFGQLFALKIICPGHLHHD
eukprot:m.181922 g.181922  ORF g.181922 m.181922 type:complete len:180 (-) comp15378_c12_seq7:144-683(-)